MPAEHMLSGVNHDSTPGRQVEIHPRSEPDETNPAASVNHRTLCHAANYSASEAAGNLPHGHVAFIAAEQNPVALVRGRVGSSRIAVPAWPVDNSVDNTRIGRTVDVNVEHGKEDRDAWSLARANLRSGQFVNLDHTPVCRAQNSVRFRDCRAFWITTEEREGRTKDDGGDPYRHPRRKPTGGGYRHENRRRRPGRTVKRQTRGVFSFHVHPCDIK